VKSGFFSFAVKDPSPEFPLSVFFPDRQHMQRKNTENPLASSMPLPFFSSSPHKIFSLPPSSDKL